jgi:tetratricopeptide (TPR) repeat protein
MKLKLSLIISFILFFSLFSIYIYSACRVNSGYADSDEIVTAGHLLSVAHPPGYPLQVFLTKFFTLLPVGGSIAFRAHIGSAFFHSLTVALFYIFSLWVLESFPFIAEKKILKHLTAVLGSLLLAFSGLFWLYSAVTEVFALNDFLLVLSLITAWKWREKMENKDKREWLWFLLTCILMGVGVSHVQTFVLFLPGFGLFFVLSVLKKNELKKYLIKRIPSGLGLLLLGFLVPNILLLWLNSRHQDFSWYFPQTLLGWYQEVTRWVYTDLNLTTGKTSSAYFSGFDMEKHFIAFPMYFRFLDEHFCGVGIILGVGGLVWFYLKNRKYFYQFLTLYLFGGLFLALYAGAETWRPSYLYYRSNVGMLQRMYLQGEVIWALFMTVGLVMLSYYLCLCFKKYVWVGISVFLMLGMLIVSYFVKENWRMGVQRDNRMAYEYGKEILSLAEPNSAIICAYDFPCFSLVYMQEVEGFRKDVAVIPRNRFFKYYFFQRNPQFFSYNYLDPKDYASELVYWNSAQRTTYVTDITEINYNFGLVDNTFYVEPVGYLFKIVRKVPEKPLTYDYLVTERILNMEKSSKNYWFGGLQDILANSHVHLAKYYSYYGMRQEAINQINLANRLNPAYIGNSNLVAVMSTYPGRNPKYKTGNEVLKASEYLELAKKELAAKNVQESFSHIRRATFIEPDNYEARMVLVDFYMNAKMYRNAYEELQRMTLIFPADIAVRQKFERLKSGIGL